MSDAADNSEKDNHAGKDPPKSEATGPPYFVNIEGTQHEWDEPTISASEIADLGGWEPELGVIEIDLRTNETRTLETGEELELRPGKGFAKKIKWKRG